MTTPVGSRFDAAVFDLDGTLVDSIDDLADAMNASLAACGFSARTVDECRSFVGDGARRFAERAVTPDRCVPETVERVLAGFKAHYAGLWHKKSKPYDGIPALLDALTARGVRLAVLSNKIEEFTVAMVSALLPRWKFDVVRGERPGVPPKPDPTGAHEIARELAVDPARVLYLGDTGTDMKTAVGAGMVPVGVLWGFRGAEELKATGARHLVSHPRDVVPLLKAG